MLHAVFLNPESLVLNDQNVEVCLEILCAQLS